MNLYLPNGYFDAQAVLGLKYNYIFCTGGRGTGKTYGTLKALVQRQKTFLYLRRTQKQVDVMLDDGFNPFQPLNEDCGYMIMPYRESKYIWGFRHSHVNADGEIVPDDGNSLVCLTASLATFADLRGISAEYIETIFYDEFIAEKGARRMKNEAYRLLNAVETINRNRELKGKQPAKLIAMSNSETLANPIYMEIGVVKQAADMQKKLQDIRYFPDRGLCLISLQNSPISEKKRNTSLYKLTGQDSAFATMALDNTYTYNESNTHSLNYRELVPLYRVGELQIDGWKGHDMYYVTGKFHGTVKETYNIDDLEFKRFKNAHRDVIVYYLWNLIVFEDYYLESLFIEMFGLNK